MSKKKRTYNLKKFLIFYGITFVVFAIIIFVYILINNSAKFSDSLLFLKEVIFSLTGYVLFWVVLLIPYISFLIIKSLISNYKEAKFIGLLKGLFLKIILPILAVYISNKALQYYRLSETVNYSWDATIENNSPKTNNHYAIDNKQRGIHLFHINDDLSDIETLKNNNFEWITLTPFVGQRDYNLPNISVPSDERYNRIKKNYKRIKEECDKFGMHVMLKPHIWLSTKNNGKWRSDIEMTNEEDWDEWFSNYKEVMVLYAKLAEELNFEQFCIGTELETTIKTKPEKWIELIELVRTCYSGKITYAANWDQEYKEISFWNYLDYIGIQAYFPLSNVKNPTLLEIENAWQPYIAEMSLISKKYNKPILFTEIGYRSLQGTLRAPWEWVSLKHYFYKISKKEQLLSYQAFFNTVWQEPWFHGIHIWEWQGTSTSDGNNTGFTIQNKPAINIIAKNFNRIR